MDKKEYRIALVIKNDGLDYDDRVRKEILSIQKLYPNIHFKIFAMLDRNEEHEGVTSYGVPYKSIFISARNKYPSAEKIILKAWQFYRAVNKDLREYDAVWCGDYHTVIIALLFHKKPVLWDLHELPLMLLGNSLKRFVLCKVFDNCRVVVHANPQRIDYLKSINCIKQQDKHFAIRNYPNFEDIDPEYDDKYREFMTWKSDRKCVYLQGLSEDTRSPYESISAVLRTKDLLAVVVGNCEHNIIERLNKEFGDSFRERIFFVGKIPQLKIPQYSGQCDATMVFYQNVEPNNFYCEANRFYQSIIMGIPVVVGNNPPMKELVDKYGFGVSIDDDGRDISEISRGLEYVINHYNEFHTNCIKFRGNLLWENQTDSIKIITERLLKG